MERPDCYFFIDSELPEEEQSVSAMHVECRDEEMPGTGWFYRGSVEGYGPFEYKCAICGNIIYDGNQGPNDEDDQKAKTASEDPRR